MLMRTVAAALVTCLLAAPLRAAEASSNTDWPAFHRGGELRGEAKGVSGGGGAEMNVRWTYSTDDAQPAGIEGGAAIVGDTVYVGDGVGKLHAVDLATGKRKWAYPSDNGFATVPLVMSGRVYAGDLGGVFHCVSADKGTSSSSSSRRSSTATTSTPTAPARSSA
jgi:outer membrane protein assembly factor BamB